MRTVVILLLALLMLVVCHARNDGERIGNENATDFTGTWLLNRAKTQLGVADENWIYDSARRKAGWYGPRSTVSLEVTIKIVHKEPELTMLRRVVVDGREHIDELTYYSDGRGERNPSAFGEDLKTKTKWEGTALVSRGSTPLGSGIVDVTERRELGVNGTQLIIR